MSKISECEEYHDSIGSHIRHLFGPINKKVWQGQIWLGQSRKVSNIDQNHSYNI